MKRREYNIEDYWWNGTTVNPQLHSFHEVLEKRLFIILDKGKLNLKDRIKIGFMTFYRIKSRKEFLEDESIHDLYCVSFDKQLPYETYGLFTPHFWTVNEYEVHETASRYDFYCLGSVKESSHDIKD